ncbi:hypothetical protein FMUAM8_41460 [Nocardia cyriacigeorgica]|nr:hypothetical protein FMUAM8_41460 [Nocardia cyriacigeorgica]
MIVCTWTGAEVKALRTVAMRMTQERFAERVGYEPPTIRKWERATAARPVRGESAEALDSVLAGLDAEQLARFQAVVGGGFGALDVLAIGPATGAGGDSLDSGIPTGAWEVEVDEMKRREFGIFCGAAVVGPAMNLSVSGGRIGVSDAARLMAEVDTLAEREQAVGGGALVRQAVVGLNRAKAVLEAWEFTERAGKAYISAVGELATIAGWLAFDADMHELARCCYTEAFALAGESGDDQLTVHLCLNVANQVVALSRIGQANPHRALGLVERAKELTGKQPPGRIHALIAAREAQSYGVLGDRSGFRRAIATAWREFEHAMEHEAFDECPLWLRFVTETEVRCHEATGVGALGDLRKSLELSADLALDHSGARNSAAYRAGWTAALARVGDVGTAVEQALDVLVELERSVSSTRTLRILEPVRVAAEGRSDDEFNRRFDELVQRSAVAI